MQVTDAAPPAAGRRFRENAPAPRIIDPAAELELVELGALAAPQPPVYVHTEDREALDALILAGLISP